MKGENIFMANDIKNVTDASTPSVVDWMEVYQQQIDLRSKARDVAVEDRIKHETEIARLKLLQEKAAASDAAYPMLARMKELQEAIENKKEEEFLRKLLSPKND